MRGDDQRHVIEARVVEDAEFERVPGVVRAAVQIRADLQRPVPQLNAAVHARRQQHPRQSIVRTVHGVSAKRRTGQERQRGSRAPWPPAVGGDGVHREQRRNEDQVWTELRRQPEQQARQRVGAQCTAGHRADERENGCEKDDPCTPRRTTASTRRPC